MILLYPIVRRKQVKRTVQDCRILVIHLFCLCVVVGSLFLLMSMASVCVCVRVCVVGGLFYLVSWSWLSGIVLRRSSGGCCRCWLGSVLEVVVLVVVEVVGVDGVVFFIKSGTIFFWM